MDYKAMAVAIKLCGSTPKVDQCKKECPYWDDGDMSKCIPRMTEDAATAITDLLARAEEAEARAEKAERERDAAVSDLETIMAYGKSVDTCTFCKNAQCYTRGGTKICFPKWRGQKEE